MTTSTIALQTIDRIRAPATGKPAPSSGTATAAADAAFSASLASAGPATPAGPKETPPGAAAGVATGKQELVHPLVAHEARKTPPLEKFEGFVLRSFVENMLPSSESSYFGEGTAGDIWRSMLAEQIGNEMAKNGGIGIAASIAGKKGSRFGGLAASPFPSNSSALPPSTAPQARAAVDGLSAMLRESDLARAASAGGRNK